MPHHTPHSPSLSHLLFTFLLLSPLLASAQSTSDGSNNSTIQDTDVPIGVPIAETFFRNSTIIYNGEETPNDAFRGVLWNVDDSAFLWTTDGMFGSMLVRVDLELTGTNLSMNYVCGNYTFSSPGEITVQTGVFDAINKKLYLFGGQLLYIFAYPYNVSGLEYPNTQFRFPTLSLPKVSFLYSGGLYAAQLLNDPSLQGMLPPKFYHVDLSSYGQQYTPNTTTYANLSSVETQIFSLDSTNGLVILGTKYGLFEVRDLTKNLTVVSSLNFPNNSFEGEMMNIQSMDYDGARMMNYFCANQDSLVYIVRVNISKSVLLNGETFLASNMTDLSTVYGFTLDPGFYCTSIVIDPAIGVGYISIKDTSDLGYIVKFNIKNMHVLGTPQLPILRDNSKIFSLHMNTSKQYLYTLLDYSIATYQYPTSCPNDCTSPQNGKCVYSECECTIFYIGSDCSEEACLNGCNEALGGGTCKNGNCSCSSEWTGPTCSQRRCPDDCLGHGTCDTANNYTCVCDDLRTSKNCGLPKYTTCESVSAHPQAKSMCLKFGTTCGWCSDDELCKTGNRIGPVEGACRMWLYDGEFETWPIIVAVVIIVFWALMFFNNAISAILEDLKLSANLEQSDSEGDAKTQRRAWWRDERSAKSWKLWDQIQFLSLYTITNMAFSTRFINFTSLFNWTNFCLPFPPLEDHNVYNIRRTAAVEQFANSVGVPAASLFWVCLIWWLITLVVSVALYGIYAAIVLFVLGKGEKYSEVLKHRLFHIISRVFLAGYLPLCCLGAWSIVANVNGTIIIPIIFFLLVGIGLPLFNFFVVKGEKTDFLFYQTRIRYGALYVQFKQDKAKFAFVVYLRKLVLAICFGFLATIKISESGDSLTLFWIQIIIPAVFMLLYIVLLFMIKPYVDMIHSFLDGFLNLLNILTLGVTILFKSNSASDRDAGLFVVMIFQITGLLSVIFSYLYTWMFYAGYNSITELCSEKKEEEEEIAKTGAGAGAGGGGGAGGGANKKDEDSLSDEKKKKKEAPTTGGDGAEATGEKKPKTKKPKKDEAKEIDEENLGDLEISE